MPWAAQVLAANRYKYAVLRENYMTIDNANTILKQYRDKKAKETGWFLSRKHIDLDYTKLITNWTSNPVIVLPEISEFPHFKMDKTGLDFGFAFSCSMGRSKAGN